MRVATPCVLNSRWPAQIALISTQSVAKCVPTRNVGSSGRARVRGRIPGDLPSDSDLCRLGRIPAALPALGARRHATWNGRCPAWDPESLGLVHVLERAVGGRGL